MKRKGFTGKGPVRTISKEAIKIYLDTGVAPPRPQRPTAKHHESDGPDRKNFIDRIIDFFAQWF